jgi:hypothetical protein
LAGEVTIAAIVIGTIIALANVAVTIIGGVHMRRGAGR